MGRHITEGGGKRIRPALLYLAAAACGFEGEKDVRYGVVFEFVHTATLIHDDIIDHAETRRGRPVLNSLYGTTLAILFGDHLFNSAMEMAIRDDDFRVVRLINQATARMIEGEIIQAKRNFFADLTIDNYMELIRRKTAYVFAAAAQSAAVLAEAGEEVEKEFFNYGLHLGYAFQLIDDYFDYAATEKQLGKPVGADLQEGKLTYPTLMLLQHDEARFRPIILNAFERQKVLPEEMDTVLKGLRSTGALEETKNMAMSHAERAIEHLTLLGPSPYLDALRQLPRFVVERQK
jgi:octaprenyl-diphosphate synthase